MPGVLGAMYSDDVLNLSLNMSSDEEEAVWLIIRRKKTVTRSSYWIYSYVNRSGKIGSSAVAREIDHAE